MKNKGAAIVGLLAGVFALISQIHATPQPHKLEIRQNGSKAKNIAARTKVHYAGSPHFVPIEGTAISYATNTHQEVIRVGDEFYLNTLEVWLVAANAEGPWVAAQSLPEEVAAIVCVQMNANPSEPYLLCALPW